MVYCQPLTIGLYFQAVFYWELFFYLVPNIGWACLNQLLFMKFSKGLVSTTKILFTWASFSLLIVFMTKSHDLSLQLLLRAFVNMGCVIALFQLSGYLSFKYLSRDMYLEWFIGFLATTVSIAVFRTWFEFQRIGTPIFDWTTFINEDD